MLPLCYATPHVLTFIWSKSKISYRQISSLCCQTFWPVATPGFWFLWWTGPSTRTPTSAPCPRYSNSDPADKLEAGPLENKNKIVYYSDTWEQMNLFFPLIEWTEDNISRYPSYDSADNWHSRVIWYSVSHHNFTTWGSKDWRNAFWTLTTERTHRRIRLWCIC